jgi:hypothetical protein
MQQHIRCLNNEDTRCRVKGIYCRIESASSFFDKCVIDDAFALLRCETIRYGKGARAYVVGEVWLRVGDCDRVDSTSCNRQAIRSGNHSAYCVWAIGIDIKLYFVRSSEGRLCCRYCETV